LLEVAARLFWLAMLLVHVPLLLRCTVEMCVGGQVVENLFSLLTLVASSLFFALKLAGWRLTSVHPSFNRMVACCLIGSVIHLALFCPSLPSEKYGIAAILSISGALWAFLAFPAIFRRLGREMRWVASHGRFKLQSRLFDLTIQPRLQAIPLTVWSHRGPPLPFPFR